MKYQLTQHAQDVMAKRGIALVWLERAVFSPERRELDANDPGLEHRLVAIPEHGQRVLRVVINIRATPERVVTAFFDRGMRGRL